MTDQKKTEFTRIFSPRTDKAVKAILLLTNGTKYKPTAEEVEHTMSVLKDAVNDIAQLYGVLPGGQVVVKDVEPEVHEGGLVEASRLDAKIEAIKRSPFAYGDVDTNIRDIPDAQLTRYATHILARICGKWDEPEAQPKNYLPLEG